MGIGTAPGSNKQRIVLHIANISGTPRAVRQTIFPFAVLNCVKVSGVVLTLLACYRQVFPLNSLPLIHPTFRTSAESTIHVLSLCYSPSDTVIDQKHYFSNHRFSLPLFSLSHPYRQPAQRRPSTLHQFLQYHLPYL
jgi:hypothetical protein